MTANHGVGSPALPPGKLPRPGQANPTRSVLGKKGPPGAGPEGRLEHPLSLDGNAQPRPLLQDKGQIEKKP